MTTKEYIEFADALKNNHTIDFDKLPEFCDMAISALSENKGEWISAKVGKLFPSNDYKCSICGNILNFDGVNCGRGDANYCPNCGADMRR